MNYYIIEAYSQFASNAVVITEIQLLKNKKELKYKVYENLYDSKIKGANGWWNMVNAWSKDNLSDGDLTYTSNGAGYYSSAIMYSATPYENVFGRFYISSEIEPDEFVFYVGGPEGRNPYYFKIFKSPDDNPERLKTRSDSGLQLIKQIDMSPNMLSVRPIQFKARKSLNTLQEITEPLSEEVFLSEGLNKIEGWNELHEYNGETICLTDFFGDDVEVLVYEEEPDEDNPLQLEFEANYSPIDEAGDNLELLVPEHLEELQIEGMTAQPVYAVSKEMDKSILYNMSDPYIMGNGKATISVSQDKLNWTNEILVKDISLDWINALPNKLFIKLSFENCKRCFVGYLSLLDWEMFADEPIVQNDITSVVQNFYSGAYDIPNHKIEASFNDGVNWVTVYENKINQIAASAIQTGKLRLRITGTKNQTLYPFSFSWIEK